MNFKNLPENWKVVRLWNVLLDIKSGDWGMSSYKEGYIKCFVIRGTDFPKVEKDDFSKMPIRYINLSKYEKNKPNVGDILVELSGGSKDQPVGRVLLLNKEIFQDAPIFFTNFVKLLRFKNVCFPRYLYHILKWYYYTGKMNLYQKQSGGQIRNFALNQFLNDVYIPLPTLPEQKRIVEILSRAEDLIKKQKEAIALIDKILMAKFLEMFGDPATNPKKWEVKRLDEVILTMRHGISRKGIKKSLKNPLKCLRPSNINRQCKVNLLDVRIVNFSERDFYRAGLTKGELVISHLNGSIDHVGKCILFVFEDKWIFDSNLLAIKVNPQKIDSHYFYWIWRYLFIQEKFKEIAVKTTGGQYLLTNERLRALQIPVPPIQLQQQFAQIVEKFEKKRKEMQNTLETLESLFKVLQKKAFTGELTAKWREERKIDWEIPKITERQAILLALLYYSHIVLKKPAMLTFAMKETFLLQKEAGLNLGYEFIPYKYGPFSKEVYQDLEELEKNLLVEKVKPNRDIEKTEVTISKDFKDWVEKLIDKLPENHKTLIQSYVQKYGTLSYNELIDYVYSHYPELSIKSKRKKK